jgi:filamentous hemagglutinin family protein
VGPSVIAGSARISSNGGRMDIVNAPGTVINWQGFSIGAQNAVNFQQQSAASQVLNRVTGSDPSTILGNLTSNGQVWLINPNGVLFGKGARVDVAGLVASTLALSDGDFLARRASFAASGDTRSGSVINQGQIRTTLGGRVWLLGDQVGNEGLITTPGGQIVLAAGRSIELVDSGAPNVIVRISAPENTAVNLGELLASDGEIDIHAGQINQQGIVRADSTRVDAQGRIQLTASSGVALGAHSETSADGAGQGGNVSIDGGDGQTLSSGNVSAQGGRGIGGRVAILGREVGILDQAKVDASGATGGGSIFIGGGPQGLDSELPNARATYISPISALIANALVDGNGGHIVAWSNAATRVYGRLEAKGGPFGGNGGFIETSGGWLDVRPSLLSVTASMGKAGTWLLDPNDVSITVFPTSANVSAGPDFSSTADSATIYIGSIISALDVGQNVIIQTGSAGSNTQKGDIFFTGVISTVGSGGSLLLKAHNDIFFSGTSRIESISSPLPITLIADSDGNGAGAIVLNPGSQILSNGGSISLMGGAADGYTRGSAASNNSGISLSGSTLDAGIGSISLKGGAGPHSSIPWYPNGVQIIDSQLRGSSIHIDGSGLPLSGGSAGVVISGSSVTSGANINLTGSGEEGRPSVDIASGTSVNATSNLRIDGSSSYVSISNATIQGESVRIIGAGTFTGYSGYPYGVNFASGTSIVGTASGDAIVVSGGLDNQAGSNALITPNGRYLIYSNSPLSNNLNGLAYDFRQYGVGDPLVISSFGNGILYSATDSVMLNTSRPYDGTTIVNFFPVGSIVGTASGETVRTTTNIFGFFNNKDVGANKLVSVVPSFYFKDLAGKPIYGLNTTVTGSITAAPVTVSVLDKVYDGTSAATLASGSLTGVIPGETLTLTSLSAAFTDKKVGSGKPVTVSGSLGGANAANYTFVQPTASITPLGITATGIVASDKIYDGTNVATMSGGSLSGVIQGDVVNLVALSGAFADKKVGNAKSVTVGASLAGLDAGNYVLAPLPQTSASITPASLAANISASDKVYDGTTVASLTGGRLTGMIAGDAVSLSALSGAFADKDVGSNKAVAVSASLAGVDAGNYVLIAPQGQASITPATLAYSANSTQGISGAALPLLSGTVSGFVGGDSLASSTSGDLRWGTTATSGSDTGVFAVNGSGLSANNYVFVQAASNATALVLKPSSQPVMPRQPAVIAAVQSLPSGTPVLIESQEKSASDIPAVAIGTLVQSRRDAVLDHSSSALPMFVGLNDFYGRFNLDLLNFDEIGRILESRHRMKKRIFASAIYKLDEDPTLADVPSCRTIGEAATGACMLTESVRNQSVARHNKEVWRQTRPLLKTALLPQIERKIAVLIGINEYTDSIIPPLQNAVPDAEAVSQFFGKQLGYEVRVLRNPTKAQIVATLNQLSTEVEQSDSVVVYYAGHGYMNDDSGAGYWIPGNALASDPGNWLSNADISKMLTNVPARQLALISDSCYSGTLTREQMLGDDSRHASQPADVLNRRSVVVMSSGSEEPVADGGKDGHSIFAWSLMETLRSVDKWQSGASIFEMVKRDVTRESPQTPQYGAILSAGHEAGGEYFYEFRQYDMEPR